MTHETWLTKTQFANLEGQTERHIERRIDANEIKWRWTEERSRNGRRHRELAASSLSAEAQLKLARQCLEAPAEQTAIVPVAQPALFPAAAPQADILRTLTEEQRAQAVARYEQIQPLVEWLRDNKRPQFELSDGRMVRNSSDLAEWVAEQHGLSASGVWKRYSRWQKFGLKGLADKPRADKGTSRVLKNYPKAVKFLMGKFSEGISLAYAYDELCREWPALYNHGSKPPSQGTIRSFYHSLPPALRDFPRMTKEQHAKRFSPYLITDMGQKPNHIWVSDHRILDVFGWNDCFACEVQRRALRIWQTVIMDMFSRVALAWVWSTCPSSRTIASALQLAIQRFGLPEVFYVDNGKDYRKIGRGAVEGYVQPTELNDDGQIIIRPGDQGLLASLGINVKYCIPRHPQSKLIEPLFSFQSKRFDKTFNGRGYAGNRPANRPDSCTDALQEHKLWLQGERTSTPLEPLSQIIAFGDQWWTWYNTEHLHSRLDGRTPIEVMNEELPPEQRRMVDAAQIEELFWDRQRRRVQNACVELNSAQYEGCDEMSRSNLYLANGTDVLVACNPANYGMAIVFDVDGRYLGKIEAKEITARGPQSIDQQQRIERERKHLRKATKKFWEITTAGVPTVLDSMRDRRGSVQMPALPQAANDFVSQRAAAAAPRMQSEDIAEEFLRNCEED